MLNEGRRLSDCCDSREVGGTAVDESVGRALAVRVCFDDIVLDLRNPLEAL